MGEPLENTEVTDHLDKGSSSIYEYLDTESITSILNDVIISKNGGYRLNNNFVLNGNFPIYAGNKPHVCEYKNVTLDEQFQTIETKHEIKRSFPTIEDTKKQNNKCLVAILPSISDILDISADLLQETYFRESFGKIFDAMSSDKINFVRILFPHTRSEHWSAGEIFISKNENKFDIGIYTHNPYGDKDGNQDLFSDRQTEIMREAAENTIKAIWGRSSEVSVENYPSPYNQRQNSEDSVSCGIVTILDIEKLINGENLSRDKPYDDKMVCERNMLINDFIDNDGRNDVAKIIKSIEGKFESNPEDHVKKNISNSDKLPKNQSNGTRLGFFSNIKSSISNNVSLKDIKLMGSTCFTKTIDFGGYLEGN